MYATKDDLSALKEACLSDVLIDSEAPLTAPWGRRETEKASWAALTAEPEAFSVETQNNM